MTHTMRKILDLRPKEGAEAVVLQCHRSNPLSHTVHDLPGGTMESGVLLRLFTVPPLVATPVILVVGAPVIIVVVDVDGDVTHLWILGGSIALIDGNRGRIGRGSGQTHLCVI